MCLNRAAVNNGFALPAAIFVVVVISAMVAAMMRLSATQITVVNQSLLASRAYWAAQSGLEWGIREIVENSESCAASETKTIDQFNVVIECTNSGTAYNEVGEGDIPLYQISSTATTSGLTVDDADYAYRSVQVDILWTE